MQDCSCSNVILYFFPFLYLLVTGYVCQHDGCNNHKTSSSPVSVTSADLDRAKFVYARHVFYNKTKTAGGIEQLSRPHLFCGGWGDKFIDIFSQVPPAAYFGVASDSSIFSLQCLLEICNVEMQAFKECHLEEVSYFKICKYESFIKGTLLFLVAITSTRSLFSLCFVKSFDGSIANQIFLTRTSPCDYIIQVGTVGQLMRMFSLGLYFAEVIISYSTPQLR